MPPTAVNAATIDASRRAPGSDRGGDELMADDSNGAAAARVNPGRVLRTPLPLVPAFHVEPHETPTDAIRLHRPRRSIW